LKGEFSQNAIANTSGLLFVKEVNHTEPSPSVRLPWTEGQKEIEKKREEDRIGEGNKQT
jgi:hypothetical protein